MSAPTSALISFAAFADSPPAFTAAGGSSISHPESKAGHPEVAKLGEPEAQNRAHNHQAAADANGGASLAGGYASRRG